LAGVPLHHHLGEGRFLLSYHYLPLLTLYRGASLSHLQRLLYVVEMLYVVIVRLLELLDQEHLVYGRRIEDLLYQLDEDVRDQRHQGASDHHDPKVRAPEHLIDDALDLGLDRSRHNLHLGEEEEAPVNDQAHNAEHEGYQVEVSRF